MSELLFHHSVVCYSHFRCLQCCSYIDNGSYPNGLPKALSEDEETKFAEHAKVLGIIYEEMNGEKKKSLSYSYYYYLNISI